MDSSSTSAAFSKKPRRMSTLIIGSMLIGEHIIVFVFLCFGIFLTRVLCASDGALVGLVENEEEEGDDTALITRRWVVSLKHQFLLSVTNQLFFDFHSLYLLKPVLESRPQILITT